MIDLFGISGLVLVSLAVWIKNEIKQDLLFITGGLLLLIYSLYLNNWIFSVLQFVFILSSCLELIKLKWKN